MMRRRGAWPGRVEAFVLVGLVLLSAWPSAGAAGDTCTDQAVADVPVYVDRAGHPSVVLLDLPCAEDVEVRIWLGDAEDQASRVWNGTAWASSAFYAPLASFDTDREGRRVVPLKAAPGATHGARLVDGSPQAGVYLLVRADGQVEGPVALGHVTWTSTRVTGAWVASGAGTVRAADADGRLLATAPLGIDRDGLALPASFGWLGVPDDSEVTVLDAATAPVAPGDVLLTHVAPDLRPHDQEMFRFVVRHEAPGGFGGLRVSDGEGILVFPPDATADPAADGAKTHVVHSGVPTYAPGTNTYWSWADPEDPDHPAVEDPLRTLRPVGHFALANGGDSIVLTFGDVLLDAFVWGDETDVRGWSGAGTETADLEGRVYVRTTPDGPSPAGATVAALGRSEHDLTDGDTATDWSAPRIFRAEQHDRAPERFAADQVRAFTCPDRCLEEVVQRVDAAEQEVLFWIYDLSLLEAVEPLAAAAERNVTVRIFLHGLPIGASDDKKDRIAWAVDTLTAAGAEVRMQQRERFDTMHAKTLVIDRAWTVVLSENANLHGWPPDGVHGNRGWGLAVWDAPLAAWFADLFADDFAHPTDSFPVSGADLAPDARPPAWGRVEAPADDRLPTLVVPGPVSVMPVVAPDHLGLPVRSPLVHALENAREEILTEQLNLPGSWSRHGWSTTSPLVTAMTEAAARGVAVKGVLAAAFEDDDLETPGNDRTAALLSVHDGIDVRLGGAPDGANIVHNKGWVVDGATDRGVVFVGSANGNLASQALNREIDLMVEDPRVAGWFRAVLLEDHARATPVAGLPGTAPEDTLAASPHADTLTAPAAPLLVVAILAVLVVFRTRRLP